MKSIIIQFNEDTPASQLFRMNLKAQLNQLGGNVRLVENDLNLSFNNLSVRDGSRVLPSPPTTPTERSDRKLSRTSS